ncbi:hypothetical protein C1H46_033139 [Malus baccata]|uniref:RING-type domain-containing protein n=1 Tax=Malus baccata TaxID=106549 RepID=A0A540L4D8_MALBA|nr:hypothetical protein C1H46_033139 [Malus baccata]
MQDIMVRQNVIGDAHCNISNGEYKLKFESKDTGEATELLEKGYTQYGCSHYRRRCRIRAPCCNEIFDCRHCHNEAKNDISIDQKHRHDIPRHQVKQVICSLCNTEQEVQQVCINCGVCMGKYFCETCKLFDDDVSKKQYHCNGCGICRIGGRENFFHCDKCGCCYSMLMKNSHPCVEGAMHHDCPVCFEFLFETRDDVTVMPCGHTIHKNCLNEMRDHYQYACPLCSKSVCDMSKVWEKYDMEIAATPMPEPYQNKLVLSLSVSLVVFLVYKYCADRIHCSSILFDRFRSSATTAGKAHKCSTMLWPGNARTVNRTTLDKPEAEPVATCLQSNWFEHWLISVHLRMCDETRKKGPVLS